MTTSAASVETVNVHKAPIMEKMQARSVAELVRLADQLGVVVRKR